ncbi:hypothetical protein Tco_1147193 [Tanacetum coccineum]
MYLSLTVTGIKENLDYLEATPHKLDGKLRLYDEVRARTLFVLSSSNRGRLLGIIDLMRQKNKRMKQNGLIRDYGILQKMEDSTRYAKEGNKIKINVEDKD